MTPGELSQHVIAAMAKGHAFDQLEAARMVEAANAKITELDAEKSKALARVAELEALAKANAERIAAFEAARAANIAAIASGDPDALVSLGPGPVAS